MKFLLIFCLKNKRFVAFYSTAFSKASAKVVTFFGISNSEWEIYFIWG